MIVNKYEVMEIIDRWLTSDEECSHDCFTCKYESLCNQTDKLRGILTATYEAKKD